MISVTIFRNKERQIYGFTVSSHGKDLVCAAVSLLTLNTVNSIEALTDENIVYDYDPKGGFLKLELPDAIEGKCGSDAALLLESMVMGLYSVNERYGNEIELEEIL